MDLLAPSSTIFSPTGFRPRVSGRHGVQGVRAGSVWGADELAALRDLPLVRVEAPDEAEEPGAGPPGSPTVGGGLSRPELVASTVVGLVLAQVPVWGEALPEEARALIDPAVLGVLDEMTPASASDAVARETLTLEARRLAWATVGHPRTRPTVAVVLADGAPSHLRSDLAAQEGVEVITVFDDADTAGTEEGLAGARDRGAVYCTRPSASLRYGPLHLIDLVQALRATGAPVAHSPARFWPWHGGLWLEDEGAAHQQRAQGGLDGGSMWYSSAGSAPPGGEGYAVHGLNAVPAHPTIRSGASAWRLHPGRPPALSWMSGEVEAGDQGPRPDLAPSYLSTVSASSGARERS